MNLLTLLIKVLAITKILPSLARLVQYAGKINSLNQQDEFLVHVNKQELEYLYSVGSGRIDPFTGLRGFDDSDGGDDGSSDSFGGENPSGEATTSNTSAEAGDYGYGGNYGSDYSGYDGGPVSWNSDMSQSAPYGTYTGWDFNSYGWGDPTTGFQNTPAEADAAYQAIANQQATAAQQAAFQSLMDQWSIGKGYDPEQEFQDQQAANNYNTGVDYSMGASKAAKDEYDSLGFSGALTGTPWSYTDLNGQQNTNWGSIGRDAASLASMFGNVAGSLAGAPGLGSFLSGIGNLSLGNVAGVTGLLGNLFGGTIGGGLGSALGNLISGKEESAVASALSSALNSAGLGLGSMLSSSLGGKDALTNAALGWGGGKAQSAIVNEALSAMGLTNSGSLSNSLGSMLSSGTNTNNSSNGNGAYRYG